MNLMISDHQFSDEEWTVVIDDLTHFVRKPIILAMEEAQVFVVFSPFVQIFARSQYKAGV